MAELVTPPLESAASAVLAACRARSWRIATAESCTGGLIGAALTAIAGSSDVVEGGFIVYADAVKTAVLGVPAPMLAAFGAVSAEVAQAMALGVLDRLPQLDIAISVTGIAGPGGGTAAKPVGLVYFGCARRDGLYRGHHAVFPGDRTAVREASVLAALTLLQTMILA